MHCSKKANGMERHESKSSYRMDLVEVVGEWNADRLELSLKKIDGDINRHFLLSL